MIEAGGSMTEIERHREELMILRKTDRRIDTGRIYKPQARHHNYEQSMQNLGSYIRDTTNVGQTRRIHLEDIDQQSNKIRSRSTGSDSHEKSMCGDAPDVLYYKKHRQKDSYKEYRDTNKYARERVVSLGIVNASRYASPGAQETDDLDQ